MKGPIRYHDTEAVYKVLTTTIEHSFSYISIVLTRG